MHIWIMLIPHVALVFPNGIFGTVQPTGLESAAPNQEGLQQPLPASLLEP